MIASTQQYYYGLGRRKCAVARVRLYPGDGQIVVNGRQALDYFGRETLVTTVRERYAPSTHWRDSTLSSRCWAVAFLAKLMRFRSVSLVPFWSLTRRIASPCGQMAC